MYLHKVSEIHPAPTTITEQQPLLILASSPSTRPIWILPHQRCQRLWHYWRWRHLRCWHRRRSRPHQCDYVAAQYTWRDGGCVGNNFTDTATGPPAVPSACSERRRTTWITLWILLSPPSCVSHVICFPTRQSPVNRNWTTCQIDC